MALKKSNYVRKAKLDNGNAARMLARPASADAKLAASQWAILTATLLDAIADSEVTHITLGRPMQGTAFLLTVNYADESKSRVGGASFEELASEALAELTDIVTGGMEEGGKGKG